MKLVLIISLSLLGYIFCACLFFRMLDIKKIGFDSYDNDPFGAVLLSVFWPVTAPITISIIFCRDIINKLIPPEGEKVKR